MIIIIFLLFQGLPGLDLGNSGDAPCKEAAPHLAHPPPPVPPPPPPPPAPPTTLINVAVGMAQSNINIVNKQPQYTIAVGSPSPPGQVTPMSVGPPNNNQHIPAGTPLVPPGVQPLPAPSIPPQPQQPSAPQSRESPSQINLQTEVKKSDTISAKILVSQNNSNPKSAVNHQNPPSINMGLASGVNSAPSSPGPRNGSGGSLGSGGPGPGGGSGGAPVAAGGDRSGGYANNHTPGQQTNKSTLGSQSDTAVASVPPPVKRPRKQSGPATPSSVAVMPFPMQATKNAQSTLPTLENVSTLFIIFNHFGNSLLV